MNISKEKIFGMKYTSELAKKSKNKGWTRSFIKFFRENKLISISIIVFLICVCMNLFLIYNFIKTLQQI